MIIIISETAEMNETVVMDIYINVYCMYAHKFAQSSLLCYALFCSILCICVYVTEITGLGLRSIFTLQSPLRVRRVL